MNSTTPATPILRIVPILPVHNLARAIDFYRQLGFSARRWQDGDGYAFINRDSLEIHLRTAPDLIENQNPCGVYFYLVDGTAAALEAEFRAAGVKVLSPLAPREWKMNEFVLSDPDLNLLRFGESVLEG
jgi:catechol 2,3-dioxygenase-like lactoylglutathione lyase family enzyme